MLALTFTLYKNANPHELTPKQLIDLENELKKPDPYVSSDQYLDFILWSRGLPSRQQSFAQFISKKLAKFPDARILEVGCGRTAILSRLLAEKGFNMTCLDKIVEPDLTNGVPAIRDTFDYRTFDLSNYDIIIAQEPCDATEHILRACKEQNKMFFMSLCGVPHKIIDGDMPKDYQAWYNHLLKVSDGYAKLIWLSLDPLSRTAVLKSRVGL